LFFQSVDFRFELGLCGVLTYALTFGWNFWGLRLRVIDVSDSELLELRVKVF
jgi:hypothetical protein